VGEAGQKLVDVEGARAEVARWRARGLTIGFTNGCFDLLHRGHVSYLAEAAHHCDRLVVGLNSDASVRRLKGPERPITDFEGRALILAGLSAVDLVVGFDADTPLSLIEALRPDRLFKGADYTRETVVGAAEVEGWGGRLVLVALEEGHSTTGLITRMKERR
jgi:D-beta-D-heptose 7-phosphate kinase/D-beta-D-heptose 1-phosphate adenosyltransferase